MLGFPSIKNIEIEDETGERVLIEANQLPTADVTLFMLNELKKYTDLNKLLDPKILKPMFTWRNGKPWIHRS